MVVLYRLKSAVAVIGMLLLGGRSEESARLDVLRSYWPQVVAKSW